MRIFVSTLGCRLNQCESDAIERRALALGHSIAAVPEEAELFILNSCHVTEEAEVDTKKILRRFARLRPGASIILTGCAANWLASRGLTPEANGFGAISCVTDKDALFATVMAEPCGPQTTRPRRRSRAFVKVQDGCNNRCAYCIVPYLRGPSRSVAPERVRAEVAALVMAGEAEICLTGIHLGAYGHDLSPKTSLAELLRSLLGVLQEARLRLGSLDPHELTPELIALLASEPRLCRHLHVPIQSGSEAVLRRMRRPHDVSRVQESVTALCRAVPGINLGADVIVGFPGETEQDFEATAALVRAQNLGYLHVFRFSPRSGTEAASFDDSIAAPVKRERSQALTALSRELSQRFVASQIGARVPVLVQQRRPGAGDEQRGLSDNYLPLCFAAADVRQAGPHWRLAVILTAQGRGPHPARLV